MIKTKKILLFIPTALLSFLSAYILLVIAHGENLTGKDMLIALVVSIFLNLVYFIWLVKKRHIGTKLTIFYIPIAFVLFVFFFYAIIFRFWTTKTVEFELGPDPFSPDTNISSGAIFGIWQKEFWSKSAQEEYRINHYIQMQTARQGSLIGHIGTDLQGWSDDKILIAFGEPAKIIEVDVNTEKWIYHPWTNNPDWEMPVYVQNGALLKIGD